MICGVGAVIREGLLVGGEEWEQLTNAIAVTAMLITGTHRDQSNLTSIKSE